MKTKKHLVSKLLFLQIIISLTIICTASGQEQYRGVNPLSGMVEANGKFYGVTSLGGLHNEGVLYEWDPVSKVYTKLHDFEYATGRYPWGDLTLLNNKLYGTTDQGGQFGHSQSHFGLIYEWDLSTKAYKIWHEMDWFNGVSATGKLSYYNGKFYGVATDGGTFGFSAIFEWDPSINVYRKMVDMTPETGRIDGAWLTLYNGKFYGATINGGAYGAGILFEWDPQTNVFTKKIDSEPSNGEYFGSTLTLYKGKLYGITFRGGIYGGGVLFEWEPIANVFTKKIDLNYENGSNALRSPLTFINDKAYGLTFWGGRSDSGVLFEWDPAVNLFTPKVNFDGDNGRMPVGALTHKNGELYGVTFYGGANDAGVLFSWNIATNKFTKHGDFTASEEPAEEPSVYGFTLIDPVSDMEVADMHHGMQFNVNDRLNIRANTNELTHSVAFFINGKRYWGENQEPYALFGDRKGDYNRGRFKPGDYIVLAVPYSEKFHTGIAGEAKSVSFRVTDHNSNTQVTSSAQVSVFPNPIVENAIIEIAGEPNSPVTVEIIDDSGYSTRIIDESLDDLGSLVKTLNSQKFKSGTYFLTIKMNKETYTKRIVIK